MPRPKACRSTCSIRPRKAKRLFFDVIPKHVDDYLTHLEKYVDQEAGAAARQPRAWHIHGGAPAAPEGHVNFALLLNLASVCNTEDKAGSVGFHHAPTRRMPRPETAPILDIGWWNMPSPITGISSSRPRHYRAPSDMERAALDDLVRTLEALPGDADSEAIQTEVYEVGKRHDFENLRDWFRALYETLLGQSQGPRMGSFIALYGKDETVALIGRVLAGENIAAE